MPDRLLGFEFAPLEVVVESVSPFRLPEYKGAVLRGGFGQFFHDLVCVTRAERCGGCPHLSQCPYSLVFETPVEPEKFAVLRKYPNAPHPFVLTPPLDARTWIPAGSKLKLELTLIGPGVRYLPHFVGVFDAMGASGRYGGTFRIRQAVSAVDGRLVYDGMLRRFAGEPVAWKPPDETQAVRQMRLEFQTPLRMRTEGRYNARPDFQAIAAALLRRIHLLNALYGDGDGEAEGLHALLAAADGIRTKDPDFHLYRWDRASGRQQRRVAMDGVLGSLTATGELTPLVPYFRAGEWLHVGSGTSMGMGRYKASYES